ncbi:hypothetical protein PY093_16595 [Cytobacillus sp. S13-E01]|uniref:hypothetical protein n=1 Tax=Cytobacillus sp. S13-E01 TaxID=3031326 RepID=UPI0023D88124|nr:hypothetical protein [Cytobacillus sp. S13-E01]MDF0728286.1 hypothetical protein [Cytobacillus sp. S13-E01]
MDLDRKDNPYILNKRLVNAPQASHIKGLKKLNKRLIDKQSNRNKREQTAYFVLLLSTFTLTLFGYTVPVLGSGHSLIQLFLFLDN